MKYHRHFQSLLVFLLFSTQLLAQSWQWEKRAGYMQNENGAAVGNDASGNIYVAGTFHDSIFTQNKKLITHGSDDIFVAKYSSSGNLKWTRQIGGTGADGYSLACTTDPAGNTYVTGSFSGSAYFGNAMVTGDGYNDIFLVKYNSSGALQWTKTFGSNSNDIGNGIAVSATGEIYITGYFYNVASFDAFTLTSQGVHDIFVAKCDVNGNVIWVKGIGGSSYDNCRGIAVDAAGNVYISGYFNNTAYFTGSNTTLVSQGGDDIIIAKYNVNGNLQWAKSAGGTGMYDIGNALCLDQDGKVYVTGQFETTCTFGNTTFTSFGLQDIFICKLSNTGNFIWAQQAGSTLTDAGTAIDHDFNNGLYVTGHYNNEATFNGQTKTTFGGADIFLLRNTNSGNPVWFKNAGSSGNDISYALSVIHPNECLVTGNFQDTIHFDNDNLKSKGSADFFVAKTTNNNLQKELSVIHQEIECYPNPSSSNSTIYFDMENPGAGAISIFNSNGEEILHRDFDGKETSFEISLEGIAPGIYFYRYGSGKKSNSGKFLVQ